MSGKGSKPRPYSVDAETFEANWERTFGVPCVHETQGEDEEGQGTADGKANVES